MEIRAVDIVRPRARQHCYDIGEIIHLADGLHCLPFAFGDIGCGLRDVVAPVALGFVGDRETLLIGIPFVIARNIDRGTTVGALSSQRTPALSDA
jgi:hypothetical protein